MTSEDAENPVTLRDRAIIIRRHARNFPDDLASRRLNEWADELDAKAFEMEASLSTTRNA
jgi:hypothetical protein